jgi:hypothetical protein
MLMFLSWCDVWLDEAEMLNSSPHGFVLVWGEKNVDVDPPKESLRSVVAGEIMVWSISVESSSSKMFGCGFESNSTE